MSALLLAGFFLQRRVGVKLIRRGDGLELAAEHLSEGGIGSCFTFLESRAVSAAFARLRLRSDFGATSLRATRLETIVKHEQESLICDVILSGAPFSSITKS